MAAAVFGTSVGFDLLSEVDDVDLGDLTSFQSKHFRGDLHDANEKTALCASLELHGFKNRVNEQFIYEQEKYNKMTERFADRGVRKGKIDTGMRFSMRDGDPYCVVSSKFAKALANGERNVLRITSLYFYIKLDDQKKAELKRAIAKFRAEMIKTMEDSGEPIENPDDKNWTAIYLESHMMSTGDFIARYGGTVVICFDYTHKRNRPFDQQGNELVPVQMDDWATRLKDKLFSTPSILHGWSNPNRTATANFNLYNFKLGPQDVAKNELITDNGKLRIQGVIRQPGE
jgi:hypothetical protein